MCEGWAGERGGGLFLWIDPIWKFCTGAGTAAGFTYTQQGTVLNQKWTSLSKRRKPLQIFIFFVVFLKGKQNKKKHPTRPLCVPPVLDCNYSGCKSRHRCCLSTPGGAARRAYFIDSGTFSSRRENTRAHVPCRWATPNLCQQQLSVNLFPGSGITGRLAKSNRANRFLWAQTLARLKRDCLHFWDIKSCALCPLSLESEVCHMLFFFFPPPCECLVRRAFRREVAAILTFRARYRR